MATRIYRDDRELWETIDVVSGVFDVRAYGAVGDGSDATEAIQAAIDACYDAGGGDVLIPAGDYGVTSISRVWSGAISVNIRGEGKAATTLQKIGTTTTPVLDFSAATLQTSYVSISDLQIIGNAKAHDGIKLTLLARMELRNCFISLCDVAVNSVGSLIFGVHECTLNSNNIGYKCRKSGSIYANLVQFYGGGISTNTSFGVDIGEANGVHFYGVDFETNGTTTDTATGAVVIRSTVDDETGFASITFTNCWFESNYGMTVKAEAASQLMLTIKDTILASAESGNVADIGAIKHLQMENVTAGTVGDTVISAATRTLLIGGVIHTYTDNSTTTTINHANSSGTLTNIKTSNASGAQIMDEASSNTNPTLVPNRNSLATGIGGTTGNVAIISGGTSVAFFEAIGGLLTTETSLWLYDKDNAALQQVTVGADDSGGSGFKVLRIAN